MSDMSDSSSLSGYGAPGKGAPAGAGADPPTLDVAGMLDKINAMRLDAASTAAARHAANQRADLRAGLAPSGPRKPGQGCEGQDQAILLAEPTGTGGVRLRITLLAAGFIIGPIGGCIREISRITGADVRSRTVYADARCPRDCREFTIEGADAAVAHAMSIMADAVKRYKSLCEGGCAGQVVSRSQHIAGVEFFYQPPPRSVVPYAACLKGHSRRGSGNGSKVAPKTGGKPVSLPKGSPTTSPTFKDAVTGGSGDEAESLPPPAAGKGPGLLKRAASASPRLMAGDALFGADSDVLDSIIASSPLMSAKMSKGDDGDAEAAALAAGLGLPASLGLSEGPDGRVMIPLDLLLASQALLAQGGNGSAAAALGGTGRLQPPKQQHTYPAGDLMSALASQMDANLGMKGGMGVLESQMTMAPAAAAAAAAVPPPSGVPFFGHCQAPEQHPFPVVHFQEGNYAGGADSGAQHAQQAPVSAFAAAAEVPAMDPAAAGKPPLSPGFHSPSTLSSRAASLPATLSLRGGAAKAGPPPGFGAGDEPLTLRSAFHVPGLFRGHAMGPASPAPSSALSLTSAFSAGGLSAAPSLERAISGSLFQAPDGSAAIAAAAAAGHHRVAAAAWGPADGAVPPAPDGAPANEAELAPAAPLAPSIWALQ